MGGGTHGPHTVWEICAVNPIIPYLALSLNIPGSERPHIMFILVEPFSSLSKGDLITQL